jgi:epoxyqueuosine reductase QueG
MRMNSPSDIRSLVLASGADLCGIAPASRFDGAPAGFRPTDIYPACKTVLVFARALPHSTLHASSCVPYTHIGELVTHEVETMTLEVCRRLEKLKITAVPVPTDVPYEHWEPDKTRGMGILSMRHAAMLAGLGVLGKNTLLINPKYGNMVQIGAILLDVELEGDPIIEDGEKLCPKTCHNCLEKCPTKALDGKTVDQRLCRPLSQFKNAKGYTLKKCNICRKVCPRRFGIPAASRH